MESYIPLIISSYVSSKILKGRPLEDMDNGEKTLWTITMVEGMKAIKRELPNLKDSLLEVKIEIPKTVSNIDILESQLWTCDDTLAVLRIISNMVVLEKE